MRVRSVAFALVVLGVVGLAAQNAKLTFEVASIKHNTNGAGGSTRLTPGRYSASNVGLYSLIVTAYGIPTALARYSVIVGGRAFDPPRLPDRCERNCSGIDQILKAHFDINATIPQGVPSTQEALRPMLRT